MKILKGIIFYILAIIGIFLMLKILVFFIPFLLGFIIAEILEPIIRYLMRKINISRKTSSILVVFTFFIIIIALLLLGGVLVISETNNLLSNFNSYLNNITDTINDFLKYINLNKLNLNSELKNIFQDTLIDFINSFAKGLREYLTKFLSGITSLPKIFINIIITILATYFISSDKFYILDQMEYHFPKKWIAKVRENSKKITNSLGLYLKAEIILILISFVIVLVGLNIFYFFGLNIKYPLLMAIIIGFIDSLPILGSGTIIIPWSIISFINKDIALGSCLIGLYLFTILVRQFVQPKIVSSNIGIHPIYTLTSMYAGYKFLGIIGLLVGPIILIILKNVFSEVIDKGIINSVIDKS